MSAYRIEYSIQRTSDEDEEDFVEIGFGSSSSHGNLADALYAIESDVSNGLWETSGDMPDPDDVRGEMSEGR